MVQNDQILKKSEVRERGKKNKGKIVYFREEGKRQKKAKKTEEDKKPRKTEEKGRKIRESLIKAKRNRESLTKEEEINER